MKFIKIKSRTILSKLYVVILETGIRQINYFLKIFSAWMVNRSIVMDKGNLCFVLFLILSVEVMRTFEKCEKIKLA